MQVFITKEQFHRKTPKLPFLSLPLPSASYSEYILLYLLVSTRTVIGQFSGPYSPVRPAKI